MNIANGAAASGWRVIDPCWSIAGSGNDEEAAERSDRDRIAAFAPGEQEADEQQRRRRRIEHRPDAGAVDVVERAIPGVGAEEGLELARDEVELAERVLVLVLPRCARRRPRCSF